MMSKKVKDINNVMNIPIYVTSTLMHGCKLGSSGHFSLSFLEMGSNFTLNSLTKCVKDLKEPMMDQYGDFLYKM